MREFNQLSSRIPVHLRTLAALGALCLVTYHRPARADRNPPSPSGWGVNLTNQPWLRGTMYDPDFVKEAHRTGRPLTLGQALFGHPRASTGNALAQARSRTARYPLAARPAAPRALLPPGAAGPWVYVPCVNR